MYVPVGTTVVLKITSSDVVHSWWIPELGGKTDATPGHTNDTWFRIDKPGEYYGQCAELCGDNHADMRARVIALPPDEYKRMAGAPGPDIQRSQAFLSLQRKARGERTSDDDYGSRDCRPPPATTSGNPEVSCAGSRSARPGGSSWLTTTDHKKIGILYLVTTFVFFMLGGVEALLMRLQLARPDTPCSSRRPTTRSSRCTARRWSSCSSCPCWPASRTTSCR